MIAVFAFFALAVTGCNPGQKLPEGMPPLTPCTLTITQDGKPLEGATISLFSIGGAQSFYPGGKTDANGKAEIFTNGKYQGVPDGKYKVVVSKRETEESKFGPALTADDPGYDEWLAKSSGENLSSYRLVEKQYTSAGTTTLEITVPGEIATLDVGKAIREKL